MVANDEMVAGVVFVVPECCVIPTAVHEIDLATGKCAACTWAEMVVEIEATSCDPEAWALSVDGLREVA